MSSLLVEGGANIAQTFLEEGLVDRLALFFGPDTVGKGGVPAPIGHDTVPAGFRLRREARFGADAYMEWTRD